MCRFLMKSVLFVVNLLLTIIGIALVGLGITVLVKLDDILDELVSLIPINLKFIPYVIIVVGAVIFLIGFCGCFGSITECKCLLITYAILMGLLAALKIFVAVMLFTSIETLKESVDNLMGEIFVDPQLNVTFHAIESFWSCCGTTGPDSYNITYNGEEYVPFTCCIEAVQLEYHVCLKQYAFEVGCNTKMADFIDKLGTNSRNVLIIVIVAELLAMSFATYIACTTKKR